MQTEKIDRMEKVSGCHCGGTVHPGCNLETICPGQPTKKPGENIPKTSMADHFRDKGFYERKGYETRY